MRRAKPHELAARIGHFEQGTERGLWRLKLKLELGLRRAAEKKKDRMTAEQMRTNIQAFSAIFLKSHAQLAATTIGWDAGVTTGEPL